MSKWMDASRDAPRDNSTIWITNGRDVELGYFYICFAPTEPSFGKITHWADLYKPEPPKPENS